MLIHLQSILRTLALVGEIKNVFIVKVLQTSINPNEMDFIPLSMIPKIKISGFEFAPVFNNELYSNSG